MACDLPEGAPAPRLCTIAKTSPSQEYGYNLHAEKGKPHFIGTVDPDSPADNAGIIPGDRIFAVNGHSIIGENHKQVVVRIKENPLQCELLVISEDGAEWYKQNNLSVLPSLTNIERVTPRPPRKESETPSEGSHKETDEHNASPTPDANWYAPKEQEREKLRSPIQSISSSTMEDKPRPRLCRLEKSSPSDEFGFNLHAEKNRGHFVGAVDKGGIGEAAGLDMGQRIVGVNGQIIYPHTAHKDVVGLIKGNPLVTDLLVASEEVDRWYSENREEFSFDYVDYHRRSFHSRGSSSHHDSTSEHSIHSKNEEPMESHPRSGFPPRCALDKSPIVLLHRSKEIEDFFEKAPRQESVHAAVGYPADNAYHHQGGVHEPPPQHSLHHHTEQHERDFSAVASSQPMAPQPSPPAHRPESGRSSENSGVFNEAGADIFRMSAKEARDLLVHRKKDPRRDQHMTLEQKYKMIANM